jgi:hypothetical protein
MENNPMRRLFLLCLLLSGLLAGRARAAESDWLTAAFPERAYDFGNVARGSQVRHAFPIINRTNSDIRIADWRTKCGCTDVRIGARLIPPGTQTTVEATINTTNFQGYKASGLTLILDRPAFVELDLNLTCFIRGDIVMNPGQIDFGTVRSSGKPPSASLNLTYGGGRSDWDILRMKTQTAKVKAQAKEISRTIDGQIHWLITATLEPAITAGYFKDEITLITNDSPAATIPISVVANVQSAVSVTPSIVNLGRVRPGATISNSNVVHVRSSTPFAVTKVTSSRPELDPVEPKPGSQADHVLKLTLKAPETPGPYHAVVTIETDLAEHPPVALKVFATVSQ